VNNSSPATTKRTKRRGIPVTVPADLVLMEEADSENTIGGLADAVTLVTAVTALLDNDLGGYRTPETLVTPVTALLDNDLGGCQTAVTEPVTAVTAQAPDPVTDPDPLETAADPAGPPDLKDCPCWRVYSDWWQAGKKRNRPGVWYHEEVEVDGEKHRADEWLCSPLYLEAITADLRGENFGRLLRFRDSLNRWHSWNMPMRMLRGSCEDLRGELLSLGLVIDQKRRGRLPDYLNHRIPERQVTAALQIGWHGEAFVLPDRSIGPGGEDVHYQSESAAHSDFDARGTLDAWRRDVAALAPGNLPLTLAIAAAFAGPMLALVHVEHGGLHFFGESSNGKTTSLQSAASVWGAPGFVRTWRATSNGLEAAAVESNDTLLVLDEIGEADPVEIGRVIYALGNGRGKSRANQLGLARRVAQWRTVLLSSGEKTVEAHQADGKQRTRAGTTVRLLDIPIAGAHGAFDALHGHESGRHLADAIKTNTAKQYGTAGRAYLEHLTLNERPDYGEMLVQVLGGFAVDGGQEARAARQLAVIALAGEVATEAGITGWTKGTAIRAALDGFAAWKSRRGSGNAEPRKILEQVRDFIDCHGDARFSAVNGSGPVVRDRAGWYDATADGRRLYLLTTAGMREATQGYDLNRATAALRAAGWLQAGTEEGRATTVHKVEGRSVRLYAIIPTAEETPC
jgi:putative DNA primase/helicase